MAAIVLAPIRLWLTLQAIRFEQTGDGGMGSNSFALAVAPGRFPGFPAAVVTQAKQRVISKGWRSFNTWKLARASLWASALVATALFVFDFFRS